MTSQCTETQQHREKNKTPKQKLSGAWSCIQYNEACTDLWRDQNDWINLPYRRSLFLWLHLTYKQETDAMILAVVTAVNVTERDRFQQSQWTSLRLMQMNGWNGWQGRKVNPPALSFISLIKLLMRAFRRDDTGSPPHRSALISLMWFLLPLSLQGHLWVIMDAAHWLWKIVYQHMLTER